LTPYKLFSEGIDDQADYLAETYLKEIRLIQPNGPYYLGGNCSGGIVAYEIARKLRSDGQSVNFLAMTESYGLDYPQKQGLARYLGGLPRFVYLFFKHIDSMRASTPLGKRIYFSNLIKRQWRKGINLGRKIIGLDQVPEPESGRSFEFRSGINYNPQPLNVDILLFRAEHQPYGIIEDNTLGWGKLVQGKLEVVIVPGYHGGLITGSRSANIGKIIAEHLRYLRSEY